MATKVKWPVHHLVVSEATKAAATGITPRDKQLVWVHQDGNPLVLLGVVRGDASTTLAALPLNTFGGGSGAWGGITGTLSDQTDLQAALDDKLAKTANLSDLTDADEALDNLGGSAIGKLLFAVATPAGVRWVRLNDDGTITLRTSAEVLSEIGAAAASHASTHQHGGADEVATGTPGANAIPKADAGGKLAIGWLPDSVVGQVEYQGAWAANTNTPAIPAASSANKGHYYVCSSSVSSSHGYANVPAVDFQTGDWIISNGSAWEKVDNTDAVTSVAGRTGAVMLEAADISDASANGRSLLTAANYAAMKALLDLEIGVDVQAFSSVLTTLAGASANGQSLVTAANYAAMKALLDLEVGVDVQAFRAELGKVHLDGGDLASGATVNIGAASGDRVRITGTTTITAFDTAVAGTRRHLTFAAALTLTHNGTSLILPTGANITTVAGDVATFESLGSGNWRCTAYLRAGGLAIVGGGSNIASAPAGLAVISNGAGGIDVVGAFEVSHGLTYEAQAAGGSDPSTSGTMNVDDADPTATAVMRFYKEDQSAEDATEHWEGMLRGGDIFISQGVPEVGSIGPHWIFRVTKGTYASDVFTFEGSFVHGTTTFPTSNEQLRVLPVRVPFDAVYEPAALADGEHEGIVVRVVADVSIAAGELVCLRTNGRARIANAGSAGDMPALGIALTAAAFNDPLDVLVHGVMRNDALWSGFTVGARVYMSNTSGDLAQTAGTVYQCVGICAYANVVFINSNFVEPGTGGGITDGDTLAVGLTFPNAGLHLLDTNASHDLIVSPGSDLTADRTLTITTGDADRTLTLGGNTTLNGGTHSGTNTGDQTITLTTDVTGSGTGSIATTIANNAVTNGKLRDSDALSVIGRSANSSGDPADIAAESDGEVLRRSGTTLGFGTVATAGIADDAVSNAKLSNMAQATIKGRAAAAGTGDPTDLSPNDASTILDGATDPFLRTSAASSGSSPVVGAVNGNADQNIHTNTTFRDFISKSLTVAAGETYVFEAEVLVTNNSGATRTYSFNVKLGTLELIVTDSTTQAASATNQAIYHLRGTVTVSATNLAIVSAYLNRVAAAAASTIGTGAIRAGWNNTTSDLTGTQTLSCGIRSSSSVSTQTVTVLGARILKYTDV